MLEYITDRRTDESSKVWISDVLKILKVKELNYPKETKMTG